MDFVRRWSEKTEIGAGRFIGWLDIPASKFWGKQAIIGFHLKNPLEGYRPLTAAVEAERQAVEERHGL